jgi:hypothetical protein
VSISCLGIPRTFAQTAPDYAALMAAPDRSDADRAADKRRDPVPFLAFAGLMPGMKVLDMGPVPATAPSSSHASLVRPARSMVRILPTILSVQGMRSRRGPPRPQ